MKRARAPVTRDGAVRIAQQCYDEGRRYDELERTRMSHDYVLRSTCHAASRRDAAECLVVFIVGI